MPYKDREQQLLAQQRHYGSNKGRYAENSRLRRERRREKFHELKSGPCADCKISYPPYVMQFDHRDSATKVGHIADLISNVSWAKVLEEVAKCDLVCANCHAERTHQRLLEA